MKWVIVEEDYLTYLRKYGDDRIPLSNYGNNKYKPFFGSLFSTDNCYYVSQVSHPQNKHNKLKDSMDFKKVYVPNSNRLLAVINLKYMFPIPKELYKELKYREIEQYKEFNNDEDKSKYIDLLNRELEAINLMDISYAARLVFQNKYNNPGSNLAKRCLDYEELEKVGEQYMRNKEKI